MRKRILAVILTLIILLTGCTEAERVNHNISAQADNFNVCRRIAVINARTDKPVFELTGYFSLSNTSTNELVVTCEVGEGKYKKNYIYLNDWTMYVVEDLSGSKVSAHHYEINYIPEMIVPYEFISER